MVFSPKAVQSVEIFARSGDSIRNKLIPTLNQVKKYCNVINNNKKKTKTNEELRIGEN